MKLLWCLFLAMSLVCGQEEAREQKNVIDQFLAGRVVHSNAPIPELLPLTDWNILGEKEAKDAYQHFLRERSDVMNHYDDGTRTPASNLNETLLSRLISNATPDTIVTALEQRRELRAKASPELRKLVEQGGILGGIAAMILEDEYVQSVLNGYDHEAQRALLACARWLRKPLPLATVVKLLNESKPKLSHAAELYLESEDSPAARQIVLDRHPGEIKIVGTNYCWYASLLYLCEEALRQEMQRPDAPDEIYTFIEESWGGGTVYVLRVSGVRAQLMSRWLSGFQFFPTELHFPETSYRYCYVVPAELQALRQFVSKYRIEELPEWDMGVCDGVQYEYLHLTKAGGVRVFMNNPGLLYSAGTVYDLLPRYFLKFIEKHKMRTQDQVNEYPPGIEVLLRRHVQKVWKQGNDMRVLVEKRNGEYRRVWHSFHDGKLGETVVEPDTMNCDKQPGLIRQPRELVHCLTTLDGKWAVEKKIACKQGAQDTFIRRDLTIGKEYNFGIPPTVEHADMIAFIPAYCKVLMSWYDHEQKYFLLNPATGDLESVHGELEPWRQQTARLLQASTQADRVWVAKYDHRSQSTQVGLYDTRNFIFTPTIAFPLLYFTSMEMWVDETEGRIYVAHQGDLLRLPLKK